MQFFHEVEYKYIYDDLKQQIKQAPPLQELLRLTQKSTKKLQCLNLYSIADKRQFDLQLQQQQIMSQILKLSQQINKLRKERQNCSSAQINETVLRIQQIKNKNIQIFDLLNKQDQLLSKEIQVLDYYFGDEDNQNYAKIKEEDEFEDQIGNFKDHGLHSDTLATEERVNMLKKQIQQIGTQISKINNGRGKWYATDHNDFIKIYNKCNGNDKKIIEQGVKILGMKNTEIMDHLQIYSKYIQLEKQKKIISQQYRQIKIYEQLEQDEHKQKIQRQKKESQKLKKQKELEQGQKKKLDILKYKEKKKQQKNKLLQQQERKQKQKLVKNVIPADKKKQIEQKNKKYILQKQNNFKNKLAINQKIGQETKGMPQPKKQKLLVGKLKK